MQEWGVTLTSDQYLEHLLGLDDRGVFRHVAADTGIDATEDGLAALSARKSAIIQQQLSKTPRAFSGAVECVIALSKRVPLAIASGALRPEIETALDALNLRACFTAIVAAGETRRAKPHPDPYARAVELLGVAPMSAVAIEDSPVGLEAARGAGLAAVGITQTYPASRLIAADAVVDSLAQIDVEFLEHVLQRRAR